MNPEDVLVLLHGIVEDEIDAAMMVVAVVALHPYLDAMEIHALNKVAEVVLMKTIIVVQVDAEIYH